MFESVALYLHHEYLSFILPAYAVCMPAAKNMAHVEGTLYSEEMMEWFCHILCRLAQWEGLFGWKFKWKFHMELNYSWTAKAITS